MTTAFMIQKELSHLCGVEHSYAHLIGGLWNWVSGGVGVEFTALTEAELAEFDADFDVASRRYLAPIAESWKSERALRGY